MQFVAGQASMQSSITTRCFPSADLWCKSNGTSRSRIQWISSRPSSAQCRATMSNLKNEISLRSEFSSSLFLRSTFGLQESHNYVKKTGISARYGAFNSDTAAIETDDHLEANKRAQVSKRLERTAGYFRRLGSLGFWGQLVCTVVSAIILAFSIVITGAATAPVTLYLTTAGIVAAFLSVFWSFGYMRLSQRLRATIDDPTKAPPRAQVVKNLKNGIVINLLGMGATLLGMQATVGVLVAKALTSSAQPFLQGQGYSPVLALDVFVVQASANALVSHFLGLVFSLELLRSVTLSQPPPENVLPKAV